MPPTLIPDATVLRLHSLAAPETVITMTASAKARATRFPGCTQSCRRIQSRYVRALADFPWIGVAVQLRLHTCRLFCDDNAGKRRIFTERNPTVAGWYVRRTIRLNVSMTCWSFSALQPVRRPVNRPCSTSSPNSMPRRSLPPAALPSRRRNHAPERRKACGHEWESPAWTATASAASIMRSGSSSMSKSAPRSAPREKFNAWLSP